MKTLAHEFLDIEAENFEVPQECYDTLDYLLEKAKEIDTNQKPIKILSDIAKLLKDEGFEYGDHNPMRLALGGWENDNFFLSGGLKTKRFECRQYSALYYSIGEILGLPLHIVSAPGHILIRWDDGKREINWETTSAKFLGNLNYIIQDNIAEKSIEKGAFLRNLTREEAKSYVFANLGILKYMKRDSDAAISFFDKTTELNPRSTEVYFNRGNVKLDKGDYEGAIADFDEALELNPHYIKAYFKRGVSKWKRGDREGAKKDYEIYDRLRGK